MTAEKVSLPFRWIRSIRDRFRTAPTEDPSRTEAPGGRKPEPESDPSLFDLVDHDFDAPEEESDRGIGETRSKDPNEK